MTERMTIEDAVAALNAIRGGDPEGAHSAADLILRRVVAPEVAQAYEDLMERATGWWFA
jgi:hypothetical protein